MEAVSPSVEASDSDDLDPLHRFRLIYEIALLRFKIITGRDADATERLKIVQDKLELTEEEAKPIFDAVENWIMLKDAICEKMMSLNDPFAFLR
jgi:hypothetical protein